MTALESLPDELLLYLMELCDKDIYNLGFVNRKFYLLHNILYRQKTIKLIPKENELWSKLLYPIGQYIQELDCLRLKSRLLYPYTSENDLRDVEHNYNGQLNSIPYISDSWKYIYSLLVTIAPVYNFKDEVFRGKDRHFRTLLRSQVMIPPGNENIPLNIWVSIKETKYVKYITKIITELRSFDTGAVECLFLTDYLDEWIKEPGVYCINLGQIPRELLKKDYTMSMLGIRACIGNDIRLDLDGKVELLGYDCHSYHNIDSWIFFKIDLQYEKNIFNEYICMISNTIKLSLLDKNSNYFNRNRGLLYDIVPLNENPHIPYKVFYKYPKPTHQTNHLLKNVRMPRLVA